MNRLLYYFYEMNHAAVAPWRAMADAGRMFWKSPINPYARTYMGRSMAASLDMFERVTRRYGKPDFNIEPVVVQGNRVTIDEDAIWEKPFCRLLHFEKVWADPRKPVKQPKLLIVAPMSGHHATLLRGTVQDMLPSCDVYITDWVDARQVPLSAGNFDLDDYIDYVLEMLRVLGPGTHVMAVCQPSVPVLAAVSIMAAKKDPCTPASMILMGGPIDTRRNPTAVNTVAMSRGVDWFRKNAIIKVPLPHPGFMRDVYPGFMQLSGFMTMNFDRHVDAHREMFWHLVQGDDDSADKHIDFYDEYMSVMDLTAEYYLQTVEKVFVNHEFPLGKFTHRGTHVDPGAIRTTALMTVEGERDDISGVGQTEAAHGLCPNIPKDKKLHHLQKDVGHYGVFNGRRFRSEIVPRIVEFIRASS